jgi:hypothetical protein
VNGVSYAVSATGGTPLTVQAALANADRKDIVVYTAGTGLQVIEGSAMTAGNFPTKPSIPANSVVLAEIYVASSTTSITSANLVDKTTIIGNVAQIVAKTANYTFVTTDAPNYFTFNGSNLVATLPSTAQADGWKVTIENLNSTPLEITPNGLNLNGSTTAIYLAQYQKLDVTSDGSNYWCGFGTPSAGSSLYAVGTAGTTIGTSSTTAATLALGVGTWLVLASVSSTGASAAKQLTGVLAQSTGTMSINNGIACIGYADTPATGDEVSITLVALVVVTAAGNIVTTIRCAAGSATAVTGSTSSQFISAVRQG